MTTLKRKSDEIFVARKKPFSLLCDEILDIAPPRLCVAPPSFLSMICTRMIGELDIFSNVDHSTMLLVLCSMCDAFELDNATIAYACVLLERFNKTRREGGKRKRSPPISSLVYACLLAEKMLDDGFMGLDDVVVLEKHSNTSWCDFFNQNIGPKTLKLFNRGEFEFCIALDCNLCIDKTAWQAYMK